MSMPNECLSYGTFLHCKVSARCALRAIKVFSNALVPIYYFWVNRVISRISIRNTFFINRLVYSAGTWFKGCDNTTNRASMASNLRWRERCGVLFISATSMLELLVLLRCISILFNINFLMSYFSDKMILRVRDVSSDTWIYTKPMCEVCCSDNI